MASKSNKFLMGAIAAVFAAGTFGGAAYAQDGVLEEVVVTATRVEENIQDVPESISTLSGDKLRTINSGGADIRALSNRVPSLQIESSFARAFPRFYIRGLGNTDFDLNSSQPVSLVYDEVVLENPIVKGFPAFDLDRIEVLRGPQGTLFGRNTPAGTIKFNSVKPSQETDVDASNVCIEVTPPDCKEVGGTYLGDGTTCGGDPDGDETESACDLCPDVPDPGCGTTAACTGATAELT